MRVRSSYADIGGMDIQKQEIREAVELPLTQFDLYRQIGIDPPRGVLLYGPPGAFLPPPSSPLPSDFFLLHYHRARANDDT